jgi:BppU N-terminal domain
LPNIIAKKLPISLDTIKQKLIYLKDFTYVIGDSIEITAIINENNVPKDLTDCTIRMIGLRSDTTCVEQTVGINIVNPTEGIVKIYPKPNNLNVLGKVIIGLIVEDLDESINVQRFGFEVADSLSNKIISEASDEIETLAKLNKLLDEYEANLVSINQQVNDLQASVDDRILTINTEFNDLEQAINNDIQELNNIILGIDNTIKYELVKTIKLEPYRLSGSSFIYFKTDIMNEPAKSLLGKQYIISLGGAVDVGTYNTSISLLNFFMQNNKIIPSVVNISDRMVGSKNINASVVYNNLSNEIGLNDIGYSLYVKSNILKNINLDSEVYCYFTPLAK